MTSRRTDFAGVERRVIAFVCDQLRVRPERITADTTLFGDLGTDGDDGSEFLEAFGRHFVVDMRGCDPSRYFGPEACPPWAPIIWFIMAFRRGTPEQCAGLRPLRIADLVRNAELGYWSDR